MSLTPRLRFAVLQRDGFRCRYCGHHPPDVQLQVDHIVPRSRGGSDDPENLPTACSDCNQGKSARLLPGAEREHDERLDIAEALTVRLAELEERSSAFLVALGEMPVPEAEADAWVDSMVAAWYAVLEYGEVTPDHPWYDRVMEYRQRPRRS